MSSLLPRACFLLLLCGTGPAAGQAPAPPPGLAPAGTVAIARVIDGDTVVLSDRREVRLVGLQAPKLPLGRTGFRAWPLAGEAKAAMEALAVGHKATLYYGGARQDRHGRELAHLVRVDGLWLQREMLAKGLARVYSFADNRAAVAEMYAVEAEARAARRGIWAHPFYAVRTAAGAEADIGSFQLVEGRVVSTAVVRGSGYINFGTDWRSDFTVTVPKHALRDARAAFGARLQRLQDRKVRVRGWLRRYNGPMIEATHPEQIEVLEP